MQRYVYLGQREAAEVQSGLTVLTPNENAARTLGAAPLSLEGLARQTLGESRIAHPLLVQRLLRDAVENTLGSADPSGTARSLLPAIRELYRANAKLETEPGSTRARRVLNVARAYQELLRQQNLVDPAETLHEAARTSPWRRPRQAQAQEAHPCSRRCPLPGPARRRPCSRIRQQAPRHPAQGPRPSRQMAHGPAQHRRGRQSSQAHR